MSRCLIYKVHTALSGGLLSYHVSSALSRTFFKFFNFFRSLIRRPDGASAALPDSSIRLPHLGPLVKPFFRFPEKSFSGPSGPARALRGISRLSAAGLPAPLQDARLYYQTPASVSTHFFRFFSFFPPSLPSPGKRPRNSTAGGHLPVEFSIAQRHRL